jgi:DNA polymerase elongation subunit (family B)
MHGVHGKFSSFGTLPVRYNSCLRLTQCFFIIDIREHDLPYHVRVSIDKSIYVGSWYQVKSRYPPQYVPVRYYWRMEEGTTGTRTELYLPTEVPYISEGRHVLGTSRSRDIPCLGL